MKEKVIFVSGHVDLEELEDLLDAGWRTKLISPQSVSTGSTRGSYGGYLIILEKQDLDNL